MDGKGHFDEVSGRNEEYVNENRRNGDPCHKVAGNLAELCSCPGVLGKVECISDGFGYLAEEIGKQRFVDRMARFFLTADSKM